MGKNLVETVMGAVVLVIAGFFLAFAYNTSSLRTVEGYRLTAKFNSVEGLRRGSDVRIGGVKVGTVVDQQLDGQSYLAVITMMVKPEIKLPEDTRASVTTVGILGDNYVRLQPGHSDTLLEPGGELTNTKDVVALEQLLGQVIYLLTEE